MRNLEEQSGPGRDAREFSRRRELHALRCIHVGFPFRPLWSAYAAAQFGEFGPWGVDAERPDWIAARRPLGLGAA
jgi:hypothetical protein